MRFIFRVLLAAAADVRSVCTRRQCRSEELLRRFNGDFLTSGFAHEVSHNGRKFSGNAGWCEPWQSFRHMMISPRCHNR